MKKKILSVEYEIFLANNIGIVNSAERKLIAIYVTN